MRRYRVARPSTARRRQGREDLLRQHVRLPSDFDGDSNRLRQYAARHSMVVALANFGGPSGGLAAAGRSSIWADTGELLARLRPDGAGVVVATETMDGWHARAISLSDAGPTAEPPA